jgi:hypothetical protein
MGAPDERDCATEERRCPERQPDASAPRSPSLLTSRAPSMSRPTGKCPLGRVSARAERETCRRSEPRPAGAPPVLLRSSASSSRGVSSDRRRAYAPTNRLLITYQLAERCGGCETVVMRLG